MQRPTSVTVFGILNIVFGTLGIVSMLVALAVFFVPIPENSNNPTLRLIHENGAYAMWLKMSVGLGLIASAALLAAGAGLLKLKPWARTLSLAYAVYTIVMGLAGSLVNYLFVVQPMMQQAQGKQGPEAAAAIGGAIGSVVGGCFGLIYPVLLLIFMMRANVKAAFAGEPPVANE